MAPRHGRQLSKAAMLAYAARRENLEALSFSDYESYLASALWVEIRRQVLSRHTDCFTACGSKATQVHHKDYSAEALAGSDLSLLLPVCRPCHKRAEYSRHGKKSSPYGATRALEVMRDKNLGVKKGRTPAAVTRRDPARDSVKMLSEDQPCRKCGGKLRWKFRNEMRKVRSRGSWYYLKWLRCKPCRANYFSDEFKVLIGSKTETARSFINSWPLGMKSLNGLLHWS